MRAQFDSVRVISGHGPIHADLTAVFPMWGTRMVRSRVVAGPKRGKKWTVRALLCVISFALGLVLLAMPPDHAMAKGPKTPPPTQAESDLMLPDDVIDTTSKPPAGKKGPKKEVKTCGSCQKESDALQTLLDAYFLEAFKEAKGTARAGGADSTGAMQQMQQLAGDWLGDGSQRKEKRDAINKKESDPNAPSADPDKLKKQIQDAVKAVQGCLPQCTDTELAEAQTPPDGETTTTTTTITPPPAEKVPALPVPIKLPNPPKCLENEKERQDFVNKWEEVQSEKENFAGAARVNALAKSNDMKDPMYNYWKESADIYQKSADDLRKIIDDANDPTKTPLCLKKGTMAPRQPAGEHYVWLTPSEQTLSRRSNISETAMAIMKAAAPVHKDAVAALHPCDKERFYRDLATLDFLGAQAGDLPTVSDAAIGAKAAVYDLMTKLNSRWDDTCKERPATRLVPGADVAENDVLLVDFSTQKEIPGGKVVIIPKDERTPIPPPFPVRADGRVTLPPTKPTDTIVFLPEDHEKVVLDGAMVQDGRVRLPIPQKPKRLIVNDTPCSGVTDKMLTDGLADQYGVRMAGGRTSVEYSRGGSQHPSCVVEVPHVSPLKPGSGKIIPKGGSTVTEGGNVIDGDQPREIQGPPPRESFAASRGTWGQAYPDQWYLKAVGWLKDDGSTVLPATAVPVTVAVIDTGVDFAHPELAGANWVNPNPGPKADVYGWNFVDNSPDIRDLSGHGTIIAGIIAASSGEGNGIAGIDPWARIMALKAMELDGHGGSIDLSQAIVYAADHGARVINLSVGGHVLTVSEQEAIDYAARKNALVVVASGNEGVDTANFSPAGLKNVLAVAAVGPDLKRQAFSNWGASIGIAAPGVDILSLRARQTDLLQMTRNEYRPGAAVVAEQYYRVTGSSFAASIVSGAASLLLSVKPTLTAAQVKRVLLQTARDLDGIGVNQFRGYGLLDIAAALAADPNVYAEAVITGVTAVEVRGRTMLRVTGTADGDSLKEARIDIGRGDNPDRWTTVVNSTNRPVVNGVLAELPADAFRGGKQWTVRIVVVDRNGLTREARFKLTLG